MKIKLVVDLPLDPKHGATAGREFEITREDDMQGGKVFFLGDAGEMCAAFAREYKTIK